MHDMDNWMCAAYKVVGPTQSKGRGSGWSQPPAEILEREKHEGKVIIIRGDALSCVLLGALVAGRLPAYGQSILRFLRDLREYRDGK
jgi:hypothetical protein